MKKRILTLLRTYACAGTLAMGLGSALADYSSTLSGLNPVVYWKLNELNQPAPTYPMANSSAAGTALNGTYYGVPTFQVTGAATNDAAVSLNGGWQYAETPYNAALNPNGPFTVEFWANITNDTTGAKSGVVSRYVTVAGGPTTQRGYLFFANNGNTTWQFRVYNGTNASTTVTSTNTPDLTPNTWYHVVGVYDGANIHIYVNGVATSSTSGTVVYAPNTNSPTRIGAGTTETTPTLFFPGGLDNVAVYHRVLSASEIYAHYDAANTNSLGYNAQILAGSPAAYYSLNEPSVPPYVPQVAANSGTLGAAGNAIYAPLGTTPGQNEPATAQFAGFATANKSTAFNNGRVEFPPITGMVTDTATITCWVKRNGNQVDTSPMFFSETPDGGVGLNFQYTTRNLAYHWGPSSHWAWTSGLLVPDDVWTFVALVVTPAEAVMYMGSTNGLTSRTNVSTHRVHDFGLNPGMLARQPLRSDRYLKGGLDEFALFDRALDYGAVSNLFYSATPAIPLVSRTPVDPVFEGMTVTFTAFPVSTIPVTYQWRKNGTNLLGQTAKTLIINNSTTNDSGNFDVVVTAGSLSVTSTVSPITVAVSAPIIVQQPVSATRFEGGAVTFSVSVQGSTPYSYQWKKGTSSILGATSSSYTIPVVASGDAGNYSVTITNTLGSVTSTAATLTVVPPTGYALSVMRDGTAPMAYYRLNETTGTTAFDYARGQNATINNNTANDITNKAAGPNSTTLGSFPGLETGNLSYRFNGDYSVVVTPAPIGLDTNTVTISAFVNWDGTMKGDLMWIAHIGSGKGFHVDGSGYLRYHWDGNWGWSSGLLLTPGQWTYVALVVEPTQAIIYMDDGTGLRSAVHAGTHPNSGFGVFGIGSDPGATYWRPFRGMIDEVAVYNRALSPGEIANAQLIASTGTPGKPIIVTEPKSQRVIAGQTASFAVSAYGALPLSSMTYVWKHAGTNIPGATGPILTIPSAWYTDAGTYQVTVGNSSGTTNSAVATLTVDAPPTFANLTNSLVMHLKFDGTELDSSGWGTHGTIVGQTNYVPGKLGSGYQVSTVVGNGVYNYVTLGTPTNLMFGATQDFSVSYWVKLTNSPGDLPVLGSGANSYGSFGLTFAPSWEEGGWSYYLGGATGSAGLYGAANTINDGNWHNLVHSFTRTGDALTYLDGALVDVRPISAVDDLDSGLTFNIGQDPTGAYGVDATMAVDDIGIWRRALTSTECQAIYQAAQTHGQSFDVNGPVKLQLNKAGADLEIIWQSGTLLWSDDPTAGWVPVPGAAAPYHKVQPSAQKKFFKVQL